MQIVGQLLLADAFLSGALLMLLAALLRRNKIRKA